MPVLLIYWSAGRDRAPRPLARQLVCPDKSSSRPNPRSLTPTNCLSCTKLGWLWPPFFTSRENSFGGDLNSKSRINSLLDEEISPALCSAERTTSGAAGLSSSLHSLVPSFFIEIAFTNDLFEDDTEGGHLGKVPVAIFTTQVKMLPNQETQATCSYLLFDPILLCPQAPRMLSSVL